jgi:hypothetical protein
LESLQPWLKTFLAGVSPQTATLLRPYASWSVLPRARHRAARRVITASAPTYARDRIGAAAHFLTWLEHNHRTLADATQHDVNTWLGQGASTRRRIRDFLRWRTPVAWPPIFRFTGLEVKASLSRYSATTNAGHCSGDACATTALTSD